MKNHITRRTLLKLGLGSLGLVGSGGRLASLGRLNAQVVNPSSDYKAMVCIFLFGGNDSNNLIVPIQTARQSYAGYQGVRGSALSLPQASLAQIAAATGEVYGLHPSLAPLQALYQQRKLAVVANVGTLLRVAEWFAFDRVILSPDLQVDVLFSPTSMRQHETAISDEVATRNQHAT